MQKVCRSHLSNPTGARSHLQQEQSTDKVLPASHKPFSHLANGHYYFNMSRKLWPAAEGLGMHNPGLEK